MSEPVHTVVVSDLHVTEAEPSHPGNPLWKRYKRRIHFIDKSFRRFVDHLCDEIDGAFELVLDGDVFDFDSVLAIPDDPPFPVSWLERRRGLHPEEPKSRFKMEVILRDHPVFVEALREVVLRGHRLVIVIGNHDLELHWPSVQEVLLDALDLPADLRDTVRICEWFFLSRGDTLIEHGNQYDAYCLCSNPIRPFIRVGPRERIRQPFGNLASRLMVNGMGLFNPHVETSFIMSFGQYVTFFVRYLMRIQPFLIWTWFWSATATFLESLNQGLRPPIREPVSFSERVNEIARRASASAAIVLSLHQLRAHAAIFNPMKVMRELWLDRALGLLAVFAVSFNVILFVNALTPIDLLWTLLPIGLLLPGFLFYAKTVHTDVYAMQRAALRSLESASVITGVRRVVHGHTHREVHGRVGDVEILNVGTWSPAFHDPECQKPFGRKCFVWIRPADEGGARIAQLRQWTDPGSVVVPGVGAIEPKPPGPHPGAGVAAGLRLPGPHLPSNRLEGIRSTVVILIGNRAAGSKGRVRSGPRCRSCACIPLARHGTGRGPLGSSRTGRARAARGLVRPRDGALRHRRRVVPRGPRRELVVAGLGPRPGRARRGARRPRRGKPEPGLPGDGGHPGPRRPAG